MATDDELVFALGKLFKADFSFEWGGARVRVYRAASGTLLRLVWILPQASLRVREVRIGSDGRIERHEWLDAAQADVLDAWLASYVERVPE